LDKSTGHMMTYSTQSRLLSQISTYTDDVGLGTLTPPLTLHYFAYKKRQADAIASGLLVAHDLTYIDDEC